MGIIRIGIIIGSSYTINQYSTRDTALFVHFAHIFLNNRNTRNI